jgi:hypothetical protein
VTDFQFVLTRLIIPQAMWLIIPLAIIVVVLILAAH